MESQSYNTLKKNIGEQLQDLKAEEYLKQDKKL